MLFCPKCNRHVNVITIATGNILQYDCVFCAKTLTRVPEYLSGEVDKLLAEA